MSKKIMTLFFFSGLITSILVLSASKINATWEWQNPLPQGNILTAVWLADQDHIYAVGYGSTIMQSSDGGENWDIVDRVTPYNLRGVWGTGNNNIYAVGEKGTILHSDGVNWEELAQVTSKNLNAIWGTGENNIFMVGDEGIILHYNGITIERHPSPVAEDLRAIWGRGPTDIYAVGGSRKVVGETMEGTGGIIIHFDGIRWSRIGHGLVNVPNLNGVWGKDNQDLYLVGGDRRNNAMTSLWHGTGGIVIHFDGKTWDLWEPNAAWNFYSIWGNGNNVYTTGAYIKAFSGDAPITYGKLFRLNGDVWEEVIVEGGDINGLLAIDGYNDTVFSVGLYGTLVRKNANDWEEISYGTRWSRFFMLGGVYPDQLFAVGGGWIERPGMIPHYNISNNRWEEVYRKDNSYVLGVWGAGHDDIYAVGEVPLHYNGTSWEEFTTCNEHPNFWVWGLTPDDIYTWANSCHFNGVSWEPFCPELTGGFHGAIWGTGTNNIYAAGDNGLILHYDGANCQDMGSGLDEILRGIWGSSSQDIYVVGGDGMTGFSGILHYDGQSWKEFEIPNIMGHLSPLSIYFGVWGTGPNNVFITGYNGIDFDKASRPSKFRGTILHYNGDRWEDMSGGLGSFNNFVWGLEDGSHVYTGGMGGAILRYTPSTRKSMEGCVTDISDNPIAGATVSLFAMGNAYWYTIASQLTESNGCFKFDQLEPGRYYVAIEQDGFLPGRHPSHGSFILEEGEELNIVLGRNQGCPVQRMYGLDAKEVAILRNYRDGILNKTPEGQEFIKLYYQWSPTIVAAMEADGAFKEEMKEAIDSVLPMIEKVVE